MIDKYTVIDKEEPRKQSVAVNGIPCTARHCVTTLNRLTQENYRLSVKVQGVNELLNDLYDNSDIEDLEWVSSSISERNYYMNTNK